MKTDKNIAKGNKNAELKVVTKHRFYGVIELKGKKDKEGKQSAGKSFIHVVENSTRMDAKNEVELVAKKSGGKLTHFGGFLN